MQQQDRDAKELWDALNKLSLESKPARVKAEVEKLKRELHDHILTDHYVQKHQKEAETSFSTEIFDRVSGLQKDVKALLEEDRLREAHAKLKQWSGALEGFAAQNQENLSAKKAQNVAFTGHSLGGAGVQSHFARMVINPRRMPLPGQTFSLFEYDAPAINDEDNQNCIKVVLKHQKLFERLGVKFDYVRRQEYGDVVTTSGRAHLFSPNSKMQAEQLAKVSALKMDQSVRRRLPSAKTRTIAQAKTAHATRFGEGKRLAPHTKSSEDIQADFKEKPYDYFTQGLFDKQGCIGRTEEERMANAREYQRVYRKFWGLSGFLGPASAESLRSSTNPMLVAVRKLVKELEAIDRTAAFRDENGVFAVTEAGVVSKQASQPIVEPPPDPKLSAAQALVSHLIDRKVGKDEQALQQNGAFFVSLIYPEEKLSKKEMAKLIAAFKDFSLVQVEEFFDYAHTEENKQRVVSMVRDILPADVKKLPVALKSLARVGQLQTHQWTKNVPHTHWDAPIMRQIREYAPIRTTVFQKGSFWRASDIHPDEAGGLVEVRQREVGLAINEVYLRELRRIGGKEFFLENPDGERIHCMQLDAETFTEKASSALDKLQLLGDWGKAGSDQHMRIYEGSRRSSKKIKTLKSMGVLVDIPLKQVRKEIDNLEISREEKVELFNRLSSKKDYYVMVPSLISGKVKDGKEFVEAEKPVTAVLCAGSGVWFGLYKPMIARLLLNGIDVMAFSYRGHELSEGVPTDQKVFQDLETVSHYLFEGKKISKDQLLLYASCMGLGPAAQYVNDHPQTNLFIDRSFSRLSTLSARMVSGMEMRMPRVSTPVASRVAQVAMPYLIDFENLSHLKNAKGDIAIITSEADEFIGPETEALKAGMPNAHHITSPANFGHAGNWLKDPAMIEQFESYLVDKQMARVTV